MKSKFLLVLLSGILSYTSVKAIPYYFNAAGTGASADVSNLSNWWTAATYSGTHPGGFTSGNVYNITGTGTSATLLAALSMGGTLQVGDGTNACTFTIPSGFAVTGTVAVSTLATLSVANATNPTFGTISGTVNFSGTVTQTVPAGTYSYLSITNTTAAVMAGGNIIVSTGINIAYNATLDMTTYTLTNNGAANYVQSTILGGMQNTTTLNLGVNANIAAGQQVFFYPYINTGTTVSTVSTVTQATTTTSSTGTTNPIIVASTAGIVVGQTAVNASIPAGSTVIAINTSTKAVTLSSAPTATASGNINFNVSQVTLSQAATASSGNTNMYNVVFGSATSGAGTLKTQNTSATPISASKIWTFTVNFNNPTGGQTILNSLGYFGLTNGSTSGINSVSGGSITVYGQLTIADGGTLNIGTQLFNCGGIQNYPNFSTSNGGGSGTGILIAKNTSGSGAITTNYNVFTWNFTVEYGGAAAQTTCKGVQNFTNLIINNTSGVGLYTGFGLSGTLTIMDGSTLSTGTNTANITGTFTTGNGGGSGTGKLNLQYGSTTPLPNGVIYNFEVDYSSTSAQTIVPGTYTILNASNTGTATRTLASGTVAISSSFIPGTTGTYTVTSGNILSLGYTTSMPTLGTNNPNLYSLTITGGTVTAPSTLTLGGAFSISGGTFIAPSGNFNVAGNWSNTGGTYTHNNGTVVLNGTNQTLVGSTSFYSFTKSVGTAATLTLPAGQTQNFASGGTLTLNGATGQLLTIASSTGSTVASINPSGSTLIYDIAVSYNTNTSGTNISATNSTDNGNNTGWTFISASTWTGANSTNWNDANNWSPVGIPPTGAIVTITKGGGNDLAIEVSPSVTSLTISAGNNVTLNSSQTLTISGFVSNAGSLTTSSGSSVILSGTGGISGAGNNTINSLTISGTSTISSTGTSSFNNLTISSLGSLTGGIFTIMGVFTNSGTYTASGGTVTFNGTGSQTVPTGTYYNLSITNTGATVTAGGNIAIGNSINIAYGATLDMSTYTLTNSATNYVQATTAGGVQNTTTVNLGVNSNIAVGQQVFLYPYISTGTTVTAVSTVAAATSTTSSIGTTNPIIVTSVTGTIVVGQTVTGANIPASTTVTAVSGTSITLSNAPTATITGTITYSISQVTLSQAATAANGNTNTYVVVFGSATSGAGTLNTQSIANPPIPTGKAWTFTLNFNNASGGQTIPSSIGYFGLAVSNTSGTNTASGNITVNGNLALSNSGSALSMGTNLFYCGIPFSTSGSGTLSTQNTSGSSALTTPNGVGQTWNFTVQYNGSSAGQTLPKGINTFNNLIISNTGGIVGMYSSIVVNGTLTINSGSIFTTGSNGGTSITTTNSSGIFNTVGTGILQTISTSTFPTPLPSGLTYSFEVDYNSTIGNQIISAGNYTTLNASGGTGTRTLAAGTIAVSTSFIPGTTSAYTVNPGNIISLGYSNSLPTLGSNSANYAGLTITAGITTAPTNLTITGDFTIVGGTFIAPSGAFTVGGNWNNTGTYSHNNGTVVLNGGNQALTGSTSFYSFTKSVGTATTLTFPSGQTQNFVSGGTLTLNGLTGQLLTILSSISGSVATINPSGSTLVYDVAVKDNANSSGTNIQATNSTDNGNNTGWTFILASTWTGASSTNWNDANNWSPNGVPPSGAIVTITKGGSNDLVIEVSPSVTSLTISAGNNVTLSSGQTLTISGALSNSGTLASPTGSFVVLSGISGISGNGTNTIDNLTLSGTCNISSIGVNTFNNLIVSGASTLPTTGTNSFTNLTISNGASLTGGNFSVSGAFTINGTGVYTPSGGTVTFNGTSTQTIPAITYYNLAVTNTVATVSAAGAIYIANNINIGTNAILDLGSNQLTGYTFTQTTQGAGSITSGSATVTLSASNANIKVGQMVVGFGIPAGTTVATYAGGASFTLSAVATGTSTGTNTLVFGYTNSGVGTLKTQSTTSPAITSSRVWSFNVVYNNTTGGQTVPSSTFLNGLTISNTSGTNTASGGITMDGTLDLHYAGSTLSMGTNTLAVGTTMTTSGSGTLSTAVLNNSGALPGGQTWNFNVVFNGASTQTGPQGTSVFNNLTISNGSTTTLWGTATSYAINGTLTINSGCTLNTSTATITGNFSTAGTGKFDVTTTTALPTGLTYSFEVDYNSTSAQTVVAGIYNNNLNLTGGNRILDNSGNNISIAGVFTSGSGTFTTTGSSVVIAGTTGIQTLPALSYNNLSIINTSGTVSAGGAIGVAGILDIEPNVTFDLGTYQLTGSFTTSGTGTLKTACILNPAITVSRTISFAVNYNATTGGQYFGGIYNNGVTFSNTSGTNTASAFTAVSGTFAITNAGSTVDMLTHQLQGSITSSSARTTSGSTTVTLSAANLSIVNGMPVNGTNIPIGTTVASISGTTLILSQAALGTYNNASLTFNFASSGNGTLQTQYPTNSGAIPPCSYSFRIKYNSTASNQTFPNGISSFSDLTIANPNGIGLYGNITVNGTLTLTTGILSIGSYNLTLANAPSGYSSSSYIDASGVGRILTGIAANGTITLPVGTSISFAPIIIANQSATSSNLTVGISSTLTNAPGDPTSVVNLQWSVIGSPSINANITFQFNNADLPSGFSTTSTCEIGTYKTGYVVTACSNSGNNGTGTPAGSNPYTVSATGFTIPTSGIDNFIVGNSGNIIVSATNWTGVFNTSWSNPLNWTNNVPTSNVDVVIQSGGYSPTFSSSQSIKNLTVNSGAVLTLGSGANLQPTLNVTNNGTIAGAGTLTLAGSAAQTVSGTGLVGNLTINNSHGVTVSSGSNNLGVSGVLTLQSGTLTTNGNVTLKSLSIANSGVLAPYGVSGNAGTITGNVTVERFIPAGYRGYRDLAPQVYNSSYTTGNIFTNWQEGGSLTHNGYGIFITGPTSTDATVADYNAGQLAANGTTGLDYSLYGNASAFTYNNANGSFYSQYAVGKVDSIINTKTTNLDVFTGYRVLVRGDRSFNLATTPILNYPAGLRMYNPTTLRATGSLVTGTVTYSTTGVTGTANGSAITSANALNANATVITNGKITQGLSMVANPYACPVSWTSVYNNSVTAGSNINGTWYFLDPTYSATGTYEGYNYATGSQFSDESNASDLIQAGQAFFVLNALTSPTPKVVFQESAKQATSTKTATFGATAPLSKIYVGVFKETNGAYSRTDGAAVAFRPDFTDKSFGTQDVLKVGYGSDNIAVSDKGVDLGIDGRLPATASDAIALKIGSPTATSYQLQVDASRYINEGYVPLLYDAYKNTTTALGSGVTTLNFTVDAKTAATYANRFSIIFTPSALAVNSIVASATLNNKIATITWNTVGEKGESYFEVEKSTDGKNFTSIGQQAAKNTASANYVATDNSVVTSDNYYRIKAVSEIGAINYSNVAKVQLTVNSNQFTVYPNPLVGKTLNIEVVNVASGKFVVSIYNVLGEKVAEQAISHSGGTATHAITINKNLAAGIYSVTIREAGSNQIVYQTSLSVRNND